MIPLLSWKVDIGAQRTHFFLLFTTLHTSSHHHMWILRQEVLKSLWAPEGLHKLAFLESVLLFRLNSFFFSSPPKIFCSGEYFLSHSFPNVILFDFHRAGPERSRWTMPQRSISISEHQLSSRSCSRCILISSNHAFNQDDWHGIPPPPLPAY